MSENFFFKKGEKLPVVGWEALDGKKGIMRYIRIAPEGNQPGIQQLFFICEDVIYAINEVLEEAKCS